MGITQIHTHTVMKFIFTCLLFSKIFARNIVSDQTANQLERDAQKAFQNLIKFSQKELSKIPGVQSVNLNKLGRNLAPVVEEKAEAVGAAVGTGLANGLRKVENVAEFDSNDNIAFIVDDLAIKAGKTIKQYVPQKYRKSMNNLLNIGGEQFSRFVENSDTNLDYVDVGDVMTGLKNGVIGAIEENQGSDMDTIVKKLGKQPLKKSREINQ